MSKKIGILLFCLLFAATSLNAQTKPKERSIKLGERLVTVKGSIFNEVLYKTWTNPTKYTAYQFLDNLRKVWIITEVEFEINGEKSTAKTIKNYICPLAKIDKQNSYNLEMRNEDIPGGKYFRLTLLSLGSGADNLYFQEQTRSTANEKPEVKAVNNVTINIINKSAAENWLKVFTK